MDLARRRHELLVAAQGQDRHLVRRDRRVELQHDALLAAHLFLRVRIEQEDQHAAVDADGRLDHVRHDVLVRLLIEVLEPLAARLRRAVLRS